MFHSFSMETPQIAKIQLHNQPLLSNLKAVWQTQSVTTRNKAALWLPPPLADTERSTLQTFSNCTPYSQSILTLAGLVTALFFFFPQRLFSLLLLTSAIIWLWVATLPIPHRPWLWIRHFRRHTLSYMEQDCFDAFCWSQVQGGHAFADKAFVLFVVWP